MLYQGMNGGEVGEGGEGSSLTRAGSKWVSTWKYWPLFFKLLSYVSCGKGKTETNQSFFFLESWNCKCFFFLMSQQVFKIWWKKLCHLFKPTFSDRNHRDRALLNLVSFFGICCSFTHGQRFESRSLSFTYLSIVVSFPPFVRSFVLSFLRSCVRACVRASVRSCVRAFVRSCIHTLLFPCIWVSK